MNKRGFTLVEVITVIALLGLIIGIGVPNIIKSSTKAKQRTLNTKIKNIEKAAVLYGQDNRKSINKKINHEDELNNTSTEEYMDNYKFCFKNNTLIPNCYYYEYNGKTTITVQNLAEAVQGKDEYGNEIKGYIKYDDEEEELILNSTDETKNINDCEIQIYEKYGKIYAVYTKESNSDDASTKCWID